MGAADLLSNLAAAGFTVTAAGGQVVVRPGSRLNDDWRRAIRAAKPALLEALAASSPASRGQRHGLSQAEVDSSHAAPWDNAARAQYAARVARLLELGIDKPDAEGLAERLHRRDVEGDDRVLCLECASYRPGLCRIRRRAGLQCALVGRDLATLLQRCPAFNPSPSLSGD